MGVIEDLERKVAALGDELRAAQVALHQARLDACPVKVGMVVRGTGRFAGLFKVIEVNHLEYNPAWVVAVPQKADGTWGTACRNLFDHYEVVHD